MAARQPNHPALKIPRGRTGHGDIDYLTLSFAELDTEVEAWAAHLRSRGVVPGDRTLVMVRQGLPLIAAAFALFKIGAVPIVIDPGMGLKSFLACVVRSQPRVLLGIPFAQLISRVARPSFRSVKIRVSASSNPLARIECRRGALTPQSSPVTRTATDLAAILFTSGSTGAPKGVCYEHGMFAAQVRLIREIYAIEPGEIDLPMLPVFALFNPALGMTTVVPEIDPSKPAKVDPAKIVQAIQQEQVTNSFGSPTLWGKIADHCLAKAITLPSMRRVLCAGAPVPATLWEKSRRFLPNGKLHSPYGATEALPISTVSADEILANFGKSSAEVCHLLNDKLRFFGGECVSNVCHLIDDKRSAGQLGLGACVGKPVRGIDIKIIAIDDEPIATLAEARELPSGEIGEIIVHGPVVTKSYDALGAATAASKIQGPSIKSQENTTVLLGTCHLPLDPSGTLCAPVWHRMGDCGYLAADGRLWFSGRKAERVVTPNSVLYTEPCEQVFRSLPGVARCALIGLGTRGAQVPALVVQPAENLADDDAQALAAALRERAKLHPNTQDITRFYFHPSFPVDVRHNAKIHRLTLAKWAITAKAHVLP
ncbi:MAG: AMP-binding protein [Verrucomicrobia bacterium]|nr:AMP-binding protein [Verrucomicrobiota bacterium]